jgi:hypothetical protein
VVANLVGDAAPLAHVTGLASNGGAEESRGELAERALTELVVHLTVVRKGALAADLVADLLCARPALGESRYDRAGLPVHDVRHLNPGRNAQVARLRELASRLEPQVEHVRSDVAPQLQGVLHGVANGLVGFGPRDATERQNHDGDQRYARHRPPPRL